MDFSYRRLLRFRELVIDPRCLASTAKATDTKHVSYGLTLKVAIDGNQLQKFKNVHSTNCQC